MATQPKHSACLIDLAGELGHREAGNDARGSSGGDDDCEPASGFTRPDHSGTAGSPRSHTARPSRTGWCWALAVAAATMLLGTAGEAADPGGVQAAGAVRGRVVDATGKPLAGLQIRAYDADLLNDDDHIQEGRTDQQGDYELHYSARPWDCCRGFAERSPDIYVEVWAEDRTSGSGSRFVQRSRVYGDHGMSNDLVVDFRIAQSGKLER